ncbi:hypothetical protein K438DRAFT_1773101 [Mycena galopus ATCC 62051]|nr:hypothetical protein K438DRAFT_1773101 [Mycena galopus ATCC 62051]
MATLEVEESSMGVMSEGMSRGFAMSAMGNLVIEFNSSDDSGLSLFCQILTMSSKKALAIEDIDNCGQRTRQPPVPRFALEKEFLREVESTIEDMQSILSRATAMIAGRTSCFLVDPCGVLLRVLRGANSLGEMHASWSALSERADLAIRNFAKYQSEFRGEEILLSPISTVPDLYDVLPSGQSSAFDLDYLYANIPHPKKQRPPGYSANTELVHDRIQVPGYLERAFVPNSGRSTYYLADGSHTENPISDHSSYGTGAGFVAPPISDRKKEKSKVLKPALTVEEVEDESVSLRRPQSENIPSTQWDTSSVSQGMLAAEVSYKDLSKFFTPVSQSPRCNDPLIVLILGAKLPNLLRGMATNQVYNAGDSINQTIRTKCPLAPHRVSGFHIPLPEVPEMEEPSFSS